MATAGPIVTELPAQEVRFLFGTMMDLRMLPSELKHTGKVAEGEFKIVAHFPAIHKTNGTEADYLTRHKTFRGGLYATYQEGPYKIDEINWDATNRAGVHMITMTKYGQVVEFPTQPSKTMPGSLKLMVQEYVESLKVPGFVIRCSGLGGALEPKKGSTDEYNVVLLSGDTKCPKKLANHVPAKYHAEDESIFHAQIGPWCGNAESFEASGGDSRMTFGTIVYEWDTDEDITNIDEDNINYVVGIEIRDSGSESGSGTLHLDNEEGYPYEVSYSWTHEFSGYNTAETGVHAAEEDNCGWCGDHQDKSAMTSCDGYCGRSICVGCTPKETWNYGNWVRGDGWEGCKDCAVEEDISHNAESFAAASTARADLPREKRNVLSSVRSNYDPSFSWSTCNWGPYFNRYAAEGSNKFYSVWVWERSPGVYTAMGAYGGLGQNPRLFNVGQTRNLQQAVNMAKKKLQSKQKKGYQNYSAEQMTQLGDSFFPVIPNTGGGDSALGSGRGVPQWYGSEETMNFEFSNLPGLPVVPNDFGESSALMSGNSVPQWYGAEVNPLYFEQVGGQDALGVGLPVISNSWGEGSAGGSGQGVPQMYGAETFEAPMPFHSPSKGDVDRVIKAIRSRHQGIRLKGSPTYLTERNSGSNKYHVFQMTNRGGFNGYGRIGHTMNLFGPMSQNQYNSKLHSKMKKGYKETGY